MRTLLCFFAFMTLAWTQSTAINVADVPQCARDCLSNSTAIAATSCASLNVACLCNTPEFVSNFYCCLSTQCKTAEQATAITFNQQQCAAVNATAPDFVGCSPLKATSSGGGVKSATTVMPGNSGPYSTVESLVSEIASFSATAQTTATLTGQAILTSNCATPLFAFVSARGGSYLFPQVGCGPIRQECCPFDSDTNAVLTTCPQDYFTTANGCCPVGYSIYSAAIGPETPCYSPASTTLIPASTPTISSLTIITNQVFSKKYALSSVQEPALSIGGIVGVTIVSVALVIITGIIMMCVKRKKKAGSRKSEKDGTTFPLQEPVLPPQPDTTSPQELASPEMTGYRTLSRSFWPLGHFSSPPAYEVEKPLPLAKNATPQELPGSTYINEHHPAFSESETVAELSASEAQPRTPQRSPVTNATGSPAVTPGLEEFDVRSISPSVISPIGSPRINRTITEQSLKTNRE